MSEPNERTHHQNPADMARMLAPGPLFAAGDTVPGLSSWLLERKLGSGGFGEVWLAKHAWDGEQKLRAVKFCTDPDARHRLVTHEKNVVLRVMKYAPKHRNIVPLLECNLDGDTPWLMYEYVEGGTLAGVIGQWRELPLRKRLGKAVKALHAVAGALGQCHRFAPPLVHRDMKPHNVLMAGSVPRVIDFGIGGVAVPPKDGASGAPTAFGARLPSALSAAGSRAYAPPEQLFGGAPNPRDDVYALGIIAYQMVMADVTATPGADAALELRDLKVPAELASLIVRSASINPDRRPKDATEWETALAALIQKAHKPPDTNPLATSGSQPVLLPEPAKPPPADTVRLPEPERVPPRAARPEPRAPRPGAAPKRRNRLLPWAVCTSPNLGRRTTRNDRPPRPNRRPTGRRSRRARLPRRPRPRRRRATPASSHSPTG